MTRNAALDAGVDATPDEGTLRTALSLALRAPSVHNSQPWRWHIGGGTSCDRLDLFADRSRWLPATDPDGDALMVSCGIALHHVRIALAADGWDTVVRRFPDPARPDLVASLQFQPMELNPRQIQLAAAIAARHTDRRRFGPRRPTAAVVGELIRAARAAGAAVNTVDPGADHARFVGHLAAIDQDVLRGVDPAELEAELDHATWLYTRHATGIPAASRLSSPRDDGLNRTFPSGTLADVSTEEDVAELLVLGAAPRPRQGADRSPRMPEEQALITGEACSAVLLEATVLGLATCVVSRPFERRAVRSSLADLLGADLEPHVLIRVGYSSSAQPIPPTPRRPLAELLIPAWESADPDGTPGAAVPIRP